LNKYIKIFLINFFLTLIVIIIIELFFGSWIGNNNYKNLIIPRNIVNIIDNPPYKTDTLGIYSRDKNGFRANHHLLEDIDILVVGGSTTEERDVDDQLIWTKILEKKLSLTTPKKILNAGIGGQTSFGHIKLFKIWFSRYDDLKPSTVLFYIGINDVLYMLEGFEKDNFSYEGRSINKINKDLLIHSQVYDQFIQYIKNNSLIHLMYLIIKGNYLSYKYNINYHSSLKAGKEKYIGELDFQNNFNQKNINYYLASYKKNLIALVDEAKKMNAKPVFITQTVAHDHWLYKYISIINETTISYCNKKQLDCIDLASVINFNNKIDFYDGIHTTPNGSFKIAEIIAKNSSYLK